MDKFKDKVVLVVDDEPNNVFALGIYLETLDMKVVTAADGKEALEIMRKNPKPDIVLMDMMMPVMDGYEALEIMKTKYELKDIPVIAVTAKAAPGDKEKCLAAGAWDYISKPVNLKMLNEKMSCWIE